MLDQEEDLMVILEAIGRGRERWEAQQDGEGS